MAHICWVGLDGSTSFHPCYEPGRRYYADRLYCRDELNSLAVSVYIEVHFSSHFSASFLNSREFLNAAAAVVVVQLLCFVRFFVIPWTAACQAPLSFTISQSLLKLMSIELVILSNHLILCCPLLLPSIFPNIRVFSSESALRIRWSKYWSFSFSISPSHVYSGLISFSIGRFGLLAVQGTFESLLQHHSLKASILQCSGFFLVQLSHPNMTTGKTIALTVWTFVSKMMSLLFNTMSRFILAFLPRWSVF